MLRKFCLCRRYKRKKSLRVGNAFWRHCFNTRYTGKLSLSVKLYPLSVKQCVRQKLQISLSVNLSVGENNKSHFLETFHGEKCIPLSVKLCTGQSRSPLLGKLAWVYPTVREVALLVVLHQFDAVVVAAARGSSQRSRVLQYGEPFTLLRSRLFT